MEQIRARIREKRGVDYTEQQISELAAVKMEKFLDARGVRSDLLEEFRRMRPPVDAPVRPNYVFDETTLFDTHRAPIRWIRRLLQPILKLFFNPNPLIQALHIQSQLNTMQAQAEAEQLARGPARDQLTFEVMHNLVLEATRMGIEVKNLKMRVESLSSRLEFNERRARVLESAVVYKARSRRPTADSSSRPRRPGPTSRAGHPSRDRSPTTGRVRRPRRNAGRQSAPPAAPARPRRRPATGRPRPAQPAPAPAPRPPWRRVGGERHGIGADARGSAPAQADGQSAAAHPADHEVEPRPRTIRRTRRTSTPATPNPTTRSEAGDRRSALRPRHQRRRRASRPVHRRTSGASRRGGGADDVRHRLRHVAERAAAPASRP